MTQRPAILLHQNPPTDLERRALAQAAAPLLAARENARALLTLTERTRRAVRKINSKKLTEPERIRRLLALDAEIAAAAAKVGVPWQQGNFIKVRTI